MNPTTKSLNDRIVSLRAELEQNKSLCVTYQRRISKLEIELKSAEEDFARHKKQLEALKDVSEIQVSDHAVIRYMERVLGLDIKAFREQIARGELGAAIKCFESGKFPVKGVNGTVKAVVDSGKIVTFK